MAIQKTEKVIHDLAGKIEHRMTKNQQRTESMKSINRIIDNFNGKVGVPILLYIFGVPGILVIIIWLFFFRGK